MLSDLESDLETGEVGGRMGVAWGLMVYLRHITRKGIRLGFLIWPGIPLFWDVSPVRALS